MPLRPTPDSMRERAFAVLGDRVVGAAFLDLYAGTGAVGLEALSRGAARAVFVEHHPAAARIVGANLSALAPTAREAELLVRPVLRALSELARRGESFALAWADPPFEEWQEGLAALEEAVHAGIIGVGATLCLECPARAEVVPHPPLAVERDLVGGASRVVMLRVG